MAIETIIRGIDGNAPFPDFRDPVSSTLKAKVENPMKRLIPICISFAVSLSLLAPMASAAKPVGKANCHSVAAKKADQNFKTHKLVTGLVVGGVTGLVIRSIIEKSKGTPKGAVMSRGGGVILNNAADRKKWDKFYKQSHARWCQ